MCLQLTQSHLPLYGSLFIYFMLDLFRFYGVISSVFSIYTHTHTHTLIMCVIFHNLFEGFSFFILIIAVCLLFKRQNFCIFIPLNPLTNIYTKNSFSSFLLVCFVVVCKFCVFLFLLFFGVCNMLMSFVGSLVEIQIMCGYVVAWSSHLISSDQPVV